MEEKEESLRKRNVELPSDSPSTSKAAPPLLTPSQSLSPPEYYDYGSADAYAQAVRTWLWAYQSWQFAQSMAPFHIHQALMHLHSQQRPLSPAELQQRSAATPAAEIPPTPRPSQASSAPAQTPAGTSQHVVASYGRRLIAELIDFMFCFILKLGIVYLCVEFDIINLDKYEKLLGDQPDLKTFIDVTQDLFPIEILNKLITSVIEALYVTFGFGVVPKGCTPGKLLMGLKVIRCETCVAVAPRDHRVLVTGAGDVPFLWSLARSLIKNFCLSFLFPICITMYAFRYNRSFYDITTSTIVIEPPPAPRPAQNQNRPR